MYIYIYIYINTYIYMVSITLCGSIYIYIAIHLYSSTASLSRPAARGASALSRDFAEPPEPGASVRREGKYYSPLQAPAQLRLAVHDGRGPKSRLRHDFTSRCVQGDTTARGPVLFSMMNSGARTFGRGRLAARQRGRLGRKRPGQAAVSLGSKPHGSMPRPSRLVTIMIRSAISRRPADAPKGPARPQAQLRAKPKHSSRARGPARGRAGV